MVCTIHFSEEEANAPALRSDVVSLLMALGLRFPAFWDVTLCARLTDADVSVRWRLLTVHTV